MAHGARVIMQVMLKHPAVQNGRTRLVLGQLHGTTSLPL